MDGDCVWALALRNPQPNGAIPISNPRAFRRVIIRFLRSRIPAFRCIPPFPLEGSLLLVCSDHSKTVPIVVPEGQTLGIHCKVNGFLSYTGRDARYPGAFMVVWRNVPGRYIWASGYGTVLCQSDTPLSRRQTLP